MKLRHIIALVSLAFFILIAVSQIASPRQAEAGGPTTILVGQVQFEGRGSPPSDDWIMAIHVVISGRPATSYHILTDQNGRFVVRGEPLEAGMRDIFVRGSHSLGTVTSYDLGGAKPPTINFGVLREGDLNGDNVIDQKDQDMLSAHLGERGYLSAPSTPTPTSTRTPRPPTRTSTPTRTPTRALTTTRTVIPTTTPSRTAIPTGCVPVNFKVSNTGQTTVITIENSWWLQVSADPTWDKVEQDFSTLSITMWFSSPHGTVTVRDSKDRVCATYPYGPITATPTVTKTITPTAIPTTVSTATSTPVQSTKPKIVKLRYDNGYMVIEGQNLLGGVPVSGKHSVYLRNTDGFEWPVATFGKVGKPFIYAWINNQLWMDWPGLFPSQWVPEIAVVIDGVARSDWYKLQ